MKPPHMLAVQLSNGHFLCCRIIRPDRHTLTHLNSWYASQLEAIFLIELGDLQSLHDNKATARHRDLGYSRLDSQVRVTRSLKELMILGRSYKIETSYVHRDGRWQVTQKVE